MGYPAAYRRGSGGSKPLPGGFQPGKASPPRPANDNRPPGTPANDNRPPAPGGPAAPFTDRFMPPGLLDWTPPGRALRLMRLLEEAGALYFGLQPNMHVSEVVVPPGWIHSCGPAPTADGYLGNVVTAGSVHAPAFCGLTGQAGPRWPPAGASSEDPHTWKHVLRQAWRWYSYGTYYQYLEVWNAPEPYVGPPPQIRRGVLPDDHKKLMPPGEQMPPENVPPRSPAARPIHAPRTTPLAPNLPWRLIPDLNNPDVWWRNSGNQAPGDPLPAHPTPNPNPQPVPGGDPSPAPYPYPDPAQAPAPGLGRVTAPEWFVRPGQRLEIGPNGRMRPGAASPVRRPPGRGEKEKKFSGRGMLPMALQGGLKIADAIGEGIDIIDALHDALPRKYRAKGEGKRDDWFPGRVPGQGNWKSTGASPLDKLDALYRHLDQVDWWKAAKNLAVNEMIDRIGGRIGRMSGEAARRSGGRSVMLGPLH